MAVIPAGPPFGTVHFWHQPFGTRVRCVLDLPCLTKLGQTTGIALAATGAMRAEFGSGLFGRNNLREPAQTLAALLSTFDKQDGTTVVYWGTGEVEPLQPLGFRTRAQWQSFPFPPPKQYGRQRLLLPALKYFAEGLHPGTGRAFQHEGATLGIFVLLLDGAIDDFDLVRDYCVQLSAEIKEDRRQPIHYVAVGWGNDFLERSQGQMQALTAHFGHTRYPLFSSVIAATLTELPTVVRDVVMGSVTVASTARIVDGYGHEITHFPSGVPGMFEFYLPSNSSSFAANVDGVVYTQKLF